MDKIDTLPKDLVTKIMLELSSNDRLALMSVFPDLRVNWRRLFQHRNSPLQTKLKEILRKHFPYTTSLRLEAMNKAYQWLDTSKEYDDLCECGEFYENCDIPIIDTMQCEVEDYKYDISDYIYKEIYNLKKEIEG